MRWCILKWIIFGTTLVMLGGNFCKAAPSPRNDDMFKELLKLDQLYSSIARPSLRSVHTSSEVGQKVQRALNMLRLQELDNLYSPLSRPRFGKRGNEVRTAPDEYEPSRLQSGKTSKLKLEDIRTSGHMMRYLNQTGCH